MSHLSNAGVKEKAVEFWFDLGRASGLRGLARRKERRLEPQEPAEETLSEDGRELAVMLRTFHLPPVLVPVDMHRSGFRSRPHSSGGVTLGK